MMRMTTESEGWWVWMSFPISTMDTRWPIPGDGELGRKQRLSKFCM
ncbi:hypothetical protein HanIR_Chr14g0717271 [Helianthus annuus]|nr:hypothetical protein HanIR_Chr14g0717271 [Helianthus annuus]